MIIFFLKHIVFNLGVFLFVFLGEEVQNHTIKKSDEKKHALCFWKICHHRPILGTCSLTKGLDNLCKWVFRDGADSQTNKQTKKQTDILTL